MSSAKMHPTDQMSAAQGRDGERTGGGVEGESGGGVEGEQGEGGRKEKDGEEGGG